MRYLKQSTAATVKIGPFVDATDGVTVESGLTISQADVRLSKNGGNYAQKNESSACTHDELGEYDCPLDTTDTATLGVLRLSVQESGALPVVQDFHVLTANVYDTLFSTDVLDTNVTQWLGTAAATPTTAGVPEVDVTYYRGGLIPAQGVTGVPNVNLAYIGDTTVPETSGILDVNVQLISDDATAADNLEAYCDGTTPIPANATQISGDATAADNLESYCDGTTPIPANATQVNGSAVTTKYLVRKPLVARSDDGLTDMWVIPWITDAGTPTNAVTNGTLTVFKASDGSSFIAGGSCTTVGTHRMRRSVTSTLIEPDEIYLITASATIDSSTRSYTTEMSGAELLSDVARISGDGTAANNLESYCDGTTPQPVNATQISGSATAADVLELLHASAISTGTVGAGTFTTTAFQTDLSEADDFHNKAIVVFTSGSLAGQARVISDFANTNGAVTVSEAFSSAPVTGATFIVIGRSQ